MTAASAEMLGNGVTTSVEMYFHPERIAAAVGSDRRPRGHRHAADPAAGHAAARGAAAGTPSTLAAGAPDDGTVEYGIGPHAAYTVPLPVLRDARPRAAGARPAAAPARRGDRDRRAPACCADARAVGARPAGRARRPRRPGAGRALRAPGRRRPGALAGARRRRRALPGEQRQAGQRRSRRCGRCSTAASGWAWAPTARRPTTALDLFADLRLAASARPAGRPARPTALTAAEAFWLATGAAADAIGRPDLGQLEVGPARRPRARRHPRPGLRAGRATRPTCSPTWSGPAPGRHVRDVWVGGRQVVRDGASTTVDTEALRADVAARAARLAARLTPISNFLQPNG